MRDWLALVQAWWALLGFNLALRWVHLDRLEKFTSLASENEPVPPGGLEWARHRQRLVSLAGRLHLPPMTCLPRALTLRWMCSRHAIPSQLCIGVNKTPTTFNAHAWVQVEGEAIGEAEDIAEKFKILEGAA
jgi:hypothetical protein